MFKTLTNSAQDIFKKYNVRQYENANAILRTKSIFHSAEMNCTPWTDFTAFMLIYASNKKKRKEKNALPALLGDDHLCANGAKLFP